MRNLALVFFISIPTIGCHEGNCERAFQKLNDRHEVASRERADESGRRADRMLLGQMADQCVADRWPSEVIDCIEELPVNGDLFHCMEMLATQRLGDPPSRVARPYQQDMSIWEIYPRLFLRQKR